MKTIIITITILFAFIISNNFVSKIEKEPIHYGKITLKKSVAYKTDYNGECLNKAVLSHNWKWDRLCNKRGLDDDCQLSTEDNEILYNDFVNTLFLCQN